MQISDIQVRTFIVLILIERALKHTTPQHLLDEYIQTVLVTKEEVYELAFFAFKSSEQIPSDIRFIKFTDDIIIYEVIDFIRIWTHMTTGDDSLMEKIANAGDN